MRLLESARHLRGRAKSPKDVARAMSTGRWPRLEMAVKAAVASVIAWRLALWLPVASAEQYPYYAPLGALVASYTSTRTSLTQAVSSILAILTGAALALTAEALVTADALLVPLVVGVGVLLAGLPVFGSQSSWVPIAALFVLVIGSEDPTTYVGAYAGLTLLGAVVAVAITTLLPTVPLAQSGRAMQQLAETLADQLDDLADGLLADDPPSSSQWRERSRSIQPVLASMRDRGNDVRQSLSLNPRARREWGQIERQRSAALVLDSVATRTADLTDLLVDVRAVEEDRVDPGGPLRAPAAHALRAAAAAVRPLGHESVPRAEEVALLRERVSELSEAVAAEHMPDHRGREMAGALVTALRRLLGALSLGLEDEGERSRAEDESVTPAS